MSEIVNETARVIFTGPGSYWHTRWLLIIGVFGFVAGLMITLAVLQWAWEHGEWVDKVPAHCVPDPQKVDSGSVPR